MKYLGSGRSGAFAWLFQRVSGVTLIVILGVHFILLHYSGAGKISYDTVAPRLADPYYKAFQLLFLAMAVYHCMNGLKLVLDDYVSSPGWRVLLTTLNWVVCGALFIFGAVTILTFTYQPA